MKTNPITIIGIPLYVYRHGGDCTNGGISSKTEIIYIETTDGFAMDVEPSLVFKVKNTYKDYKALVQSYPSDATKEMIGPMAGGNYASTSDSRFSKISNYPLAIHDRYEASSN